MIIGLSIVVLVLVFLLASSAYVVYRYASKLIELEEHVQELNEIVEESLDSLDEQYQVISSISQQEVFFDDPVVKTFIEAMKDCRTTIEQIAVKISNAVTVSEESDEILEENKDLES